MGTGRYADGYKREWGWVEGLDEADVEWLRELPYVGVGPMVLRGRSVGCALGRQNICEMEG